jgi:hypothetical protein
MQPLVLPLERQSASLKPRSSAGNEWCTNVMGIVFKDPSEDTQTLPSEPGIKE